MDKFLNRGAFLFPKFLFEPNKGDGDDGGEPNAGDDDKNKKPDGDSFQLDEFLKTQPEHVRVALKAAEDARVSTLEATLDKVRKESQGNESRVREIEAEKRRREQAALQDAGEHEKLANELKSEVDALKPQLTEATATIETLRGQIAERDEILQAHVNAIFEKAKIPDAIKALIIEKPVVKQLQWLTENAESMSDGKNNDNKLPNSPDPDATPVITEEQRRQRAARTL